MPNSRPEPAWWSEARRLRAAGEKRIVIASLMNKSESAIARALNPELYRAAWHRWAAKQSDIRAYWRAQWHRRTRKDKPNA